MLFERFASPSKKHKDFYVVKRLCKNYSALFYEQETNILIQICDVVQQIQMQKWTTGETRLWKSKSSIDGTWKSISALRERGMQSEVLALRSASRQAQNRRRQRNFFIVTKADRQSNPACSTYIHYSKHTSYRMHGCKIGTLR